jgi:hypothetical protein
MRNSIPRNYTRLVAAGAKAVAGLQRHQSDLGVVHNPASGVSADVDALTGAADAQRAARHAQLGASQAQADAAAAVDGFLPTTVDLLTPYLGRSWSAKWAQAGFTRNLSVPTTLAGRLEVTRSLARYLKDHPQQQNGTLGVTEAKADSLHDALELAINGVTRCKAEAKAKRKAREQAEEALRRRLRLVFKELEQLLPEDDARWNEFGFNAPGETQAPEAVTGLTVGGGGPGDLYAAWQPSARADRYLVEVQVAGEDVAFRRLETSYDTDAELEGLPPGTRVNVRVVAANDAGESAPSAAVTVTVPALAAAA